MADCCSGNMGDRVSRGHRRRGAGRHDWYRHLHVQV